MKFQTKHITRSEYVCMISHSHYHHNALIAKSAFVLNRLADSHIGSLKFVQYSFELIQIVYWPQNSRVRPSWHYDSFFLKFNEWFMKIALQLITKIISFIQMVFICCLCFFVCVCECLSFNILSVRFMFALSNIFLRHLSYYSHIICSLVYIFYMSEYVNYYKQHVH